MALYGSEMWGTQTEREWTKRKCKSIAQAQRRVLDSACRAKLCQYPLLLNMTLSPALCCQELNPQRSPPCLLVLRPDELSTAKVIIPLPCELQHTCTQKIRPKQIMMKEKEGSREAVTDPE